MTPNDFNWPLNISYTIEMQLSVSFFGRVSDTVSRGAYYSTEGPLITLFFESLEKQPCKQKTVLAEEWFSTKWTNKGTKINRVI